MNELRAAAIAAVQAWADYAAGQDDPIWAINAGTAISLIKADTPPVVEPEPVTEAEPE